MLARVCVCRDEALLFLRAGLIVMLKASGL